MLLVFRRSRLVRAATVLVLFAVMSPAVTGHNYRLYFIEHLQEVLATKAVLAVDEGTGMADYKKPRYSALDYLALAVSLILVVRVQSTAAWPMQPTHNTGKAHVREIFIPPERWNG